MARLKGGRAPDEAEWAAFVAREADACWIYGVASTGIYCRPACPARIPLRQNVALFSSGAEARDASYRACKRCTPDAG